MKKNIAFLPVICISIRESKPEQVKVGECYYIDRLTICFDRDGDAYGEVYDAMNNRVGNMLLSHFRTA